jgi:hypothetical protein
MDLLVLFYNYTHDLTYSTLQLFSCLQNYLRLTASELPLNVSQTALLGNAINLEESVVSRILDLSYTYFWVLYYCHFTSLHTYFLVWVWRESESYITTDGQSASLSSTKQLRVCWCGAVRLKRGRVCRLQLLAVLASAVIFGSESRGTRDHILLSRIWDFPCRRLLRLAGLRLRYSTPPPHGIHTSWSGRFLVFYYLRPTVCRTRNSRVQFLVTLVTVCLCTCCLRKVHEPLPSRMSSSVSGSPISAFRRCLPSSFLAMDTWLRLHHCGFRRHVTIFSIVNYIVQRFIIRMIEVVCV